MQIAIILYQFKIQNFQAKFVNSLDCVLITTVRKVSNYGFFFWPVFFPTRAELGPSKSPYL